MTIVTVPAINFDGGKDHWATDLLQPWRQLAAHVPSNDSDLV